MGEARKRSGISGRRSDKLQQLLKQRIFDAFYRHILLKLTRESLRDHLDQDVFSTKYWRLVPRHVQSYLRGYITAKRQELDTYHTGWMLWVDGGLMTREQVDNLTHAESSSTFTDTKAPDYRSPWQRVDNDKSRHVWLDTPKGRPMPQFPIDQRFRS